MKSILLFIALIGVASGKVAPVQPSQSPIALLLGETFSSHRATADTYQGLFVNYKQGLHYFRGRSDAFAILGDICLNVVPSSDKYTRLDIEQAINRELLIAHLYLMYAEKEADVNVAYWTGREAALKDGIICLGQVFGE